MTDIHIHTKYSLLDSTIEPEELVKKCKEQGKKAICVTEHGNLYSDVEMYKLCQKYGIKYLMGVEAYICDNVDEKNKTSKYYHLILIAKNEAGRLNLNTLMSLACQHKYYGKPRIDYNMLLKYKEGIICCSACMVGEIQKNIINNYDAAKTIALKYKKDFGDDYYLEYQSHSDPTQQLLNKSIVNLAHEINCKFIVTTDAHYINPEDQKYQTIFVGIGQVREVGETYNDCYIQSEEDILNICVSVSRNDNLTALATTDEIADKCNVKIPLSTPIMRHEKVPDEFKSEIDYLKYLCVQGWRERRIKNNPTDTIQKYKDRLVYELNAIEQMGFEGYYLLVWSYVNSVKRRGIARGSGGGSLVAYLINIVDTDPVKYGLYFERFIDVGALQLLKDGKITKSQLKLPDFDCDFGKDDREKVLEFVINRYGKENVVSLGSFQYIWAKGAIKDIGKVLDIPFEIRNEMTANLDKETIQEALDLGLLDKYLKTYPELFVYANRLAGLPKSFSMHPCGKVIANNPIMFYNAVDYNDDGNVILQGDMHSAEDLGLIKADFLGLRTVDIIYDVLDMIQKDYQYIAPHNIDFNDSKVFENFRNGYTDGIFQFESTGMKSTLKNIECNSLYDLTVANALYRPGSMKYIDNYANRRKGIEQYEYLHEDLKPILKDSYGIIVFQEQLIEIGRLAGLSNPDELRKATAKKKADLLAKLKPELFNGLSKRGWTEQQLNQLWNDMLNFAKYSFNKSHACAYSIIAYICMYLKTYHPKEFVCAWINNYKGKIEKIPVCINEAKRIGIKIYDCTYEHCSGTTILYQDGILLGTESIKGCNKQNGIDLKIIYEKFKGTEDWLTVYDFIKNNTSIDSSQIEALITLNVFSHFGKNKYLLSIITLYDKFIESKIINKKTLNSLNVSEDVIKQFSAKETPAQYREIDNMGLINELSKSIEDKSLSIKDQISKELEYLEYINYINPDAPDEMYYVADLTVYKDKTKPYLSLYNIKTGETLKTKITKGKRFIENPFNKGNVLKVTETIERQKTKMINGEWKKVNEYETVLEDWIVY